MSHRTRATAGSGDVEFEEDDGDIIDIEEEEDAAQLDEDVADETVGYGVKPRTPSRYQMKEDPRHNFHESSRYEGPRPVVDYLEEREKPPRVPLHKSRPDHHRKWECLPQEFQQTLKRSVTRIGIGMHEGRPSAVRLRPAHAGEGRYFVRVPRGSIDLSTFPMMPWSPPSDHVPEEKLLEDFYKLHGDGEDGGDFGRIGLDVSKIFDRFKASEEYKMVAEQGGGGGMGWVSGDVGYDFEERETQDKDWHLGNNGRERLSDEEYDTGPDEKACDGADGEVRISATLENAHLDDYGMPTSSRDRETYGLCTTLRKDGSEVKFVEHLLSALEASGVDNCRIEIEGGDEVPIIDGSALPWSEAIIDAGVTRARGSTDGREVRKLVREPGVPVSVHDGESFISFVPGPKTHFTMGVDHRDRSSAIGKNFYSWCPENDLPFRQAVAPARTYNVLKDVDVLLKGGMLKGGSMENGIVADGKYWCTGMNRFGSDEPTRHRLLDLVGNLSLMAEGGNAGLPRGHIVAFHNGEIKSSLSLKFAKAFLEAHGVRDSWSDATAWDPDLTLVMGKQEVDIDIESKRRNWDLNEYEYRTGAEASDANSIFKSHEEEKAWSDKFWEYRRQQGAGKRNDRGGGVDKVTI